MRHYESAIEQKENYMNKPLKVCIVCMSCIMLSGLIGLCTNLINAVISPEYFINIMHWEQVESLIRSAGAQGLYQGIVRGLFFALVFSCVYIISNNAELNISAVLKWIISMGVASIGLWVIGGIIAIVLFALSPEFYKQTFIGVLDGHAAVFRYAWVGGSIWGISFGGIIVIIIGTVLFRKRSKHCKENLK